MFGSSRKPYSAITVQVDRLTSEQYEDNDLSGIVDLVEVIRIQASGPTEAARAIRKKLKYGNTHRQLRALTILDGLIQNAGARFQKTFADEPLLERLRILARDHMVDEDVRKKCNVLFRQWANAYKGTPGLERIAMLYKELPKTARPRPDQSKVVRETEREAHSPTSPDTSRRPSAPNAFPSSSTGTTVSLGHTPAVNSNIYKKDKKGRNKPFNIDKEKPAMMEALAQAGVASTNLQNALKLVNRENQRVSENQEVVSRFETCKVLRRQILRYIQLVESEQWIGSLLSANDELVNALMAYEIFDKSIDDDSDSDYEVPTTSPGAGGHARKSSVPPDVQNQFAGLSMQEEAPPAKPPRPGSIPMPPPQVPNLASGKLPANDPESEEEFDEDDPFGDQNAVKTPYAEKSGMTWKDV